MELFEAMKLYRLDVGIGYTIKNYGDGLLMIKPKDGQGRCLFFTEIELDGQIELVALLSYKKESQKLPEQHKRIALQRRETYLENRK